jgi:hypothetical protein
MTPAACANSKERSNASSVSSPSCCSTSRCSRTSPKKLGRQT